MASSATVVTSDGLTWYYKQQGTGPHVVLIPSGDGDCDAFDKVLGMLSKSFTVTTFDMPGMSRSVPVPPEAVKDVTGDLLASQVIGLMDKLDIQLATFYGCSSGGITVLALEALYPDRVRNAIVHEVPMGAPPAPIQDVLASGKDDDQLLQLLEPMHVSLIGSDQGWESMGTEYQNRIRKNLLVWVHGYMTKLIDSIENIIKDEANLKKKPIDWTLGGHTPTAHFFRNTFIAIRAGIPLSLLPSQHFPQITVPDKLAEHIESTTRKYL